MKVSIGQHSIAGRKPTNQDALGARIAEGPLLALKGIATAIADGISSSRVSHIASEVAVKTFLQDYYATAETWSTKASALRVLNAINGWLFSQSERNPQFIDRNKGYVCTFSAVVFKGQSAHVFHVGDSRVYRFNEEGLEQLTQDHRLWVSQNESYLNRAFGMGEHCPVDYCEVPVKTGDIFITATDGVYEFLTPSLLSDYLARSPTDLQVTVESLVGHALEQGSDDNLSLQLIRIDALAERPTHTLNRHLQAAPVPTDLSAGSTFDGYDILRTLHTGTRSHVFLAQDTSTGKTVIIKTPGVDIASDDEALERFLTEEWIARRLNNDHLLKADLQDRPRNFLYTVYEYVEGQTLAQWARDNPHPSLETVRNIIEQVAKGLHALHRKEMLHQDLRPENIMINLHGVVKIIDYGAVYVAGLEESNPVPPDTHLLGTALYSAPEYFLGEPGSDASDQFSLGVIAYFLLSGKYPYGPQVARAKTRSAQRRLRYQSLVHDDAEIPVWVDAALQKAVHPFPEKRYEQLFEFIHDLRHPNPALDRKIFVPLIDRNPVAVWQGISFVLALLLAWQLFH